MARARKTPETDAFGRRTGLDVGPPLRDNILRCMAAKDRAVLGLPGLTAEEADALCTLRTERIEHGLFIDYLHFRQVNFLYANPTKATTIEPGWPDFTLLHAEYPAFCIEFKRVETGRLRPNQQRVITRLLAAGIYVAILTQAGDAIRLTQQRFKLPGALPEAS